MNKKIIIWGGSGQAVALKPIVESLGYSVDAIFDDTPGLASPFHEIPIFLGWDGFKKWKENKNLNEIAFCIAIGNPYGKIRLQIHEKLLAEGLQSVVIAHPNSIIAADAVIGEGTQIMAGAIIQSRAVIGKQCIINSGAIVEHEVQLDDVVEVQPGAIILGLTQIGFNSTIGSRAVILSRLKLGSNVNVSAGSVIDKNITDNGKIDQFTPRLI